MLIMLASSLSLSIWIFIILKSFTIGIKIEFARDSNFNDVIVKSHSAEKCNDLPEGWDRVSGRSGYIRTDTCTIVYPYYGCAHYESVKVLPGRTIYYPWSSGSYHICNDEYGSFELNVDFTKFNEFSPESTYFSSIPIFSLFSSRQHITPPETVAYYRDLCSCVNFPQNVRGLDKWSINNHANDLLAYYGTNCVEMKLKPIYIRAGYSKTSRELYIFANTDKSTNIRHKIQSIGPNYNSTYFTNNCRYTVITDLELLETSINTSQHASLLLATQESLDTTNTFRKGHMLRQKNRRIEFFSSPYFKDSLFTRDMPTECNQFQTSTNRRWITKEIGSIKTKSCVILYSDHKCFGRSIKVLPPGSNNLTKNWEQTVTGPETLALLYSYLQSSQWTTKSFRFCNDEFGGPQLNVDVTKYHPDKLSILETEVYESHKNICFCKNIPKYIQEIGEYSINNYGNSLLGYFDTNCSTAKLSPLWIPAGRSSFSIGLGAFHKLYESNGSIHKIVSIGPDPKADYFRTNCAKLYFTIAKCIIFIPNKTKADLASYTDKILKMRASKNLFTNSGYETTSHQFNAHLQIPEVVLLEIGTNFRDFFRIDVSKSFMVETRIGDEYPTRNLINKPNQINQTLSDRFGNLSRFYTFFEEPSLLGGLREAYENLETLETPNTTIRSTGKFSVDEAIRILPCTEQTANGYLNVVKNNRVQYLTLGIMKGLLGDQEMTADEVRHYMDNRHVYLGDSDNNSIWSYTTQFMTADYGISTFINSTSAHLFDCLAETTLLSLVESIYG